ncbi:MAG: M28 family peptidase [Thermoplasmatota archaeon]
MRVAVAALVLCFLAGCQAPAATEPTTEFDGPAAYDFVEGLVTTADGGPRYRVPGTALHAEAADWLEDQMTLPNWEVRRQSFTGADYEALDHGQVASYRGDRFCSEPDASEVANLTFHNLVATTGPANPMVWLGAHWDSKEEANQDPDVPGDPVLGANDGASGVGLLLQFMHQAPDVPFGLGIVFFDGEDGFEDCHPLAGSLYFAQTMEPGLVDRFILLDMVGDEDAQFIRETQSTQSDRPLMDLLWKHGQRHAPEAFTTKVRQVADDHVPFIEQGVRAVDLIDAGRPTFFPPYWHTTQDTMQNISPDMLGAVGQTLLDTLTDPAFEDGWP